MLDNESEMYPAWHVQLFLPGPVNPHIELARHPPLFDLQLLMTRHNSFDDVYPSLQ